MASHQRVPSRFPNPKTTSPKLRRGEYCQLVRYDRWVKSSFSILLVNEIIEPKRIIKSINTIDVNEKLPGLYNCCVERVWKANAARAINAETKKMSLIRSNGK